MKKSFIFRFITTVYFGSGELKKLHEKKFPGKKALIVTSKGKSHILNGGLETLKHELELAGIEYVVYSGAQQNPSFENVEEGTEVIRANKCDFVISLGGGSSHDCGKAIALMANNDRSFWEYMKGEAVPTQPQLPVVTVTTTAGTGSEINPFFVINNNETHEKLPYMRAFFDCRYPVFAIVDPELLLTVPADYTAYQGFDAMFHAIEFYVCNGANLMTHHFATRCISTNAKYLPVAVNDGKNLEAREMVAFANTMAGLGGNMSGGITPCHDFEHAMGALHANLPHGAGLLMVCREFYKFLIEHHHTDDRFIELAKLLGKEDASEPMDFVRELDRLMNICGVADLKMSDYGITRDELPKMNAILRKTCRAFTNIAVEMTEEDCLGIYERSYR